MRVVVEFNVENNDDVNDVLCIALESIRSAYRGHDLGALEPVKVVAGNRELDFLEWNVIFNAVERDRRQQLLDDQRA